MGDVRYAEKWQNATTDQVSHCQLPLTEKSLGNLEKSKSENEKGLKVSAQISLFLFKIMIIDHNLDNYFNL